MNVILQSDQSGRNRYMLNGATVQNKRVIDLFNSVQLNVNNPHFLIMQGRITKVLNMKPPEVSFNELHSNESVLSIQLRTPLVKRVLFANCYRF